MYLARYGLVVMAFDHLVLILRPSGDGSVVLLHYALGRTFLRMYVITSWYIIVWQIAYQISWFKALWMPIFLKISINFFLISIYTLAKCLSTLMVQSSTNDKLFKFLNFFLFHSISSDFFIVLYFKNRFLLLFISGIYKCRLAKIKYLMRFNAKWFFFFFDTKTLNENFILSILLSCCLF